MITAKELKSKIEIMDKTLQKFNVEIIDIGIGGLNKQQGWFNIILEISTIDGGMLNDAVDIKINIYDEDGIIFTTSHYLEEGFEGYDTIQCSLLEEGLAFKVERIKLFAVKGY